MERIGIQKGIIYIDRYILLNSTTSNRKNGSKTREKEMQEKHSTSITS